jgi:hypothetical protein
MPDFFDCASAAEHFASGKMLLPEKPEMSGFSGGGLLYSRRALPPRAPPLLCPPAVSQILCQSQKSDAIKASLFSWQSSPAMVN